MVVWNGLAWRWTGNGQRATTAFWAAACAARRDGPGLMYLLWRQRAGNIDGEAKLCCITVELQGGLADDARVLGRSFFPSQPSAKIHRCSAARFVQAFVGAFSLPAPRSPRAGRAIGLARVAREPVASPPVGRPGQSRWPATHAQQHISDPGPPLPGAVPQAHPKPSIAPFASLLLLHPHLASADSLHSANHPGCAYSLTRTVFRIVARLPYL